MTDGLYQEWMFGLEFSMPIGFRREMSGVRNAQLALARDRAMLQEQELEVSHQLAYVIRELEANRILSQTNFNRRIASERELKAVVAVYEAGWGEVTLDTVLNTQRRLAEAESDYFRSLVDYNKSIAAVHFRKGSLLEYNGIKLAEGPWTGKAYFDAKRRARARDAGIYMDYGFTRPSVISRGAYQQHAGSAEVMIDGAGPSLMGPEEIPAPQPTPAGDLKEPEAPKPLPTEGEEPAILEPGFDTRNSGSRSGSFNAGHSQPLNIDSPNNLGKFSAEPPTERRETESNSTEPATQSGPTLVAPKETGRVRRAAYQQPVEQAKPAGNSSIEAKWTAVKRSGKQHESVSNPSSAETDRTASGWKGVQR